MQRENKLKRIVDIVLDRKTLILTYLYSKIILDTIIMVFFYDVFWYFHNDGFKRIFGLWTLLVLVYEFLTKKYERDREQIAFYVFIGLCVLSYALHMPSDLPMLLIQAMFCITFFSSAAKQSRQGYKDMLMKVGKAYIIAILCMSAASILFYLTKWHLELPFGIVLDTTNSLFTGRPEIVMYKVRYFGFYEHPVSCSVHCSMVLALWIWLYKNKKAGLSLGIINACVQLYMLYLVDSRTGMLFFIVVVFCMILYALRQKFSCGKTVLIVVGGIALMALALFVLKHDRVVSVIELLKSNFWGTLDDISSKRLTIWKVSAEDAMRHPLLGAGWAHNEAPLTVNAPWPHSAVMAVFLYTGFAGIAAYFTAMILSAKKVIGHYKRIEQNKDVMLLFILIGIVAISLVENLLVGNQHYFETAMYWLILGYFVYYKKDAEA